MSRFDSDPISIDPEEYIGACTSREITELVDELYDKHPEEFDEIIEDALVDASVQVEDEVRSESHRQFILNLSHLRREWYGMAKEDADIIAILAKKYGAV